MTPKLSERLKRLTLTYESPSEDDDAVEKAIALVTAAEEWAKAAHANKRPGILMDEEVARNALLALLPEEPHD